MSLTDRPVLITISSYSATKTRTYRCQKALRLPQRSAVSQEADDEHESSHTYQNVRPLLNHGGLRKLLQKKHTLKKRRDIN